MPLESTSYCVILAEVDASVHLNLILLLGIAVFFGTVGARLFQKLHIPQVVGYIVIGLILGGSVLKLIDIDTVLSLSPLNMFALGIIGFTIGHELKLDIFRRYGKQFIIILISEGVFAFVAVGLLTGLVAYLFTNDLNHSIAMGVVLGAISSATAPAAARSPTRRWWSTAMSSTTTRRSTGTIQPPTPRTTPIRSPRTTR